MSKNNLQDASYLTTAIVHIKNGKATVELGTMFGLSPGESIPMEEGTSKIRVKGGSGSIIILNGHSII